MGVNGTVRGLQGDRVAYGWIRRRVQDVRQLPRGQSGVQDGSRGSCAGPLRGLPARLRAPSYMAIKLPDALDSVECRAPHVRWYPFSVL